MKETLLGQHITTKKELLEALKDVPEDTLIFLSNRSDFFTIDEIVEDEEKEIIIRASNEPY